MPSVASAPGSSSASTNRASLVRPPPPSSSSRRSDCRSRRSSMDVAPPIRDVSSATAASGVSSCGVQCDGVGVQQRPDRHFVADRGLGHRNADRDPLAGEVALEFAELPAVADDHGDLGQVAAMVDVLVQDALGNVPQLMDRATGPGVLPPFRRTAGVRDDGGGAVRGSRVRAAQAAGPAGRLRAARSGRPRPARPQQRRVRAGGCARADAPRRRAAGDSSRGSSATRSGLAPRKPWTTVSGEKVT